LREPSLSDEVVRLRRWRMEDLECVREAGLDPGIPVGTTVPAVWSVEAGMEFIVRQWSRAESGEGVSLAVESGGVARGLVVLLWRDVPGVAGIGYWIVPGARRQGLAGRAVRLASDWALSSFGVARLEAWVEPGNEPSLRVLAAAGFAREGVLRNFLLLGSRRADAVVLSRIAGE
jgi:ribosomal-protein-alanine N-acetyltransferase